MRIEIKGEVFDLELVNNWCREEYQALLERIDDLTDIPDEAEDLVSMLDGLSREEQREVKRELKALSRKQRDIVKDIAEIRYGIVRELLETNDIKYDEDFWHKHCDVDDLNELMLTALNKDVGKPSKKK